VNPLSYVDFNRQIGIRLRHWIVDTEDQNTSFHRKEILDWGDANEDGKTKSIFKVKRNGSHGA
jgi:hypothetical protein